MKEVIEIQKSFVNDVLTVKRKSEKVKGEVQSTIEISIPRFSNKEMSLGLDDKGRVCLILKTNTRPDLEDLIDTVEAQFICFLISTIEACYVDQNERGSNKTGRSL